MNEQLLSLPSYFTFEVEVTDEPVLVVCCIDLKIVEFLVEVRLNFIPELLKFSVESCHREVNGG